MNEWHTSYQRDMEIVFLAAAELIQEYPSPLRERAEAYLRHFDPTLTDSTKNYICYLLPFWVKDEAGIDQAQCRSLSAANVFVMLYYFILDDLMDSRQEDWKYLLALGNLFQLTFTDLYRSMFPSDSSFWRYYRQYVDDWAVSVTTALERNSFEHDSLSLAGKASPVKLASTGAMLLGAKEPLIADVSHLIDQVLATLQMVDDWMDWEDDLREGSDNSLLDFVRVQEKMTMQDNVTPELINQSIYFKDALYRFAQVACDRQTGMEAWRPSFTPMIDFHQSLTDHLTHAHSRAMTAKRSLRRGGLVHYLSSVRS